MQDAPTPADAPDTATPPLETAPGLAADVLAAFDQLDRALSLLATHRVEEQDDQAFERAMAHRWALHDLRTAWQAGQLPTVGPQLRVPGRVLP